MKTTAVPRELQGVLWSVGVDQLDIEKDKNYIIHQIFAYGTLDQIKWLYGRYSKAILRDEFIHHPTRVYNRPVYYFIKNYILDLNKIKLNEDNYVTSISGPIKRRTAASI
ncbi:hypothetical protein A2690_02890 [Candidatus Roizmanbacteria bacterium RIFCSPHIGHO2_01_FULL_39_12b]|uniref:DUF6922 domain-containing protein n=1 Tax=Candidatus Roizmanbacteria bacterium RIFCSPHIGHO2_01_FULL_39_12b TaxID=1802030 RepID=A0A1F7G7X6_9BACT|nr:MAG: hypothetical protein A2690_02890 [Candidatus Roizmanbacteria bacterium RIFCSPHIGHO2_01_FULL_39_12b]OGK45928.1 MAG: hypothetical protein A3B46_02705 [Candidatus Roizmanbacteria bacterium RIFCSPLOWO2_01_FULL_39_19]